MNREYNPKRLRHMDRVCIYRCSNCHRIFLLPFDARDSKTPITCKSCQRYIDADKDIIGDSWYTNEFPEVKFTIADTEENDNKPLLLVWFYMECRDCHKMSWIVWRGRLFDYSTCICHEPIKEEAEQAITVITKPIVEDTVIDQLIVPGALVERLKEYCFEHDTTKKIVIIEALRAFLDNRDGFMKLPKIERQSLPVDHERLRT